MKAPSPLLGFNNNFKHKGAVYHIQTEDSGIKHPHIITHLFADGGRILKSIKTSYATVLDDPQMVEVVRTMMKEQHKAMIVALRDGQFDPGGAREVKLPTDGPFAHATSAGQTRGESRGGSGAQPAVQAPVIAAVEPVAASVIPTESAPSPARAPNASFDVAALERAAAAAAATSSARSPVFRPQSDLPPPPANVLQGQQRPHGEYQSVNPTKRPASMRPPSMNAPANPALKSADTGRRSIPPTGGSPSQRPSTIPGRYALTRPASIFATNKPATGSIFGEDLISERSLDEVILSYLAEDLEGEKK